MMISKLVINQHLKSKIPLLLTVNSNKFTNRYFVPTVSKQTINKNFVTLIDKRIDKEWLVEDKLEARFYSLVNNAVNDLRLCSEFKKGCFDHSILLQINYAKYEYVKKVLEHQNLKPSIATSSDIIKALLAVQFIAKYGWDEYLKFKRINVVNKPNSVDDWPDIKGLDKKTLHDTYETVDYLQLWKFFSEINFCYNSWDNIFTHPNTRQTFAKHMKITTYSNDETHLRCLAVVKYIHHMGWKQFCFLNEKFL